MKQFLLLEMVEMFAKVNNGLKILAESLHIHIFFKLRHMHLFFIFLKYIMCRKRCYWPWQIKHGQVGLYISLISCLQINLLWHVDGQLYLLNGEVHACHSFINITVISWRSALLAASTRRKPPPSSKNKNKLVFKNEKACID